MSKFSDQEKAKIFAESRRLLKDDGRTPPPVTAPEPPPIEFEDAQTKWNRESEDFERKRAAERRRQERASEQIIRKQANDLALEARVSALEERMDAVEQAVSGFNGLAEAAAQFSDAVSEKMHALEALTARLDRTLSNLREAHARETNGLRDRLAASEASHGRETAMLVKELNDARREIDRRADVREHARNRMAVMDLDEKVENVVALVREDIRQHQR
jgi:hypothetical protein